MPTSLAAGAIYTAIDVGGAIKGEDLISGTKLSDEERLTRGAFAIVPGVGGIAAKSLIKHMPALKTVIKTVSKPVDDAIKPLKSTIDSIGLKRKQSIETSITQNKKQASPVISNLKTTKPSITPGIKTTKHQETLDIPTRSKLATKLADAKKLGKAHADQLKFALTHPVIATVTSKAGQKSIRGTAKFIDDALRPVGVRTVQTTTDNKVFAGFERGESSGKLKEKAENYIAIKQAEKDAIRGTVGKNPEIVKFTEEQLATKPPYSRDPVKWQKKGGKIEIDEEGTWTYIDWIFLQIEFLILGVFRILSLLGW